MIQRRLNGFISGWFVIACIVWAIRCAMIYITPLSPDEAYYRIWAFSPAWSYFDHPPMVAWWIYCGIHIAGDNPIGIRLFAPISVIASTWFIARSVYLYKQSFSPLNQENVKIALIVSGFFNVIIATNIFSIIMTPDVPLSFFSALLLWSCVSLVIRQDKRYWLLIGLALGCGFMSKYEMALAGLGIVLWVFMTKQGRCHLREPWPWVGCMISLVIIAPCLIWNAHHQWISFIKQGSRVGGWHLLAFPRFFSEWLLGQSLLTFPPIFIGFVIGFYKMCRKNNAVCQLVVWICSVPLIVYTIQCFFSRVQANWTIFLFPFFCFGLVMLSKTYWRSVILSGLCINGVIYLQVAKMIIPLSPHWDVALRQTGNWPNFGRDLKKYIPENSAIMADEYGLASELAFYDSGHKIIALGKRWSFFNQPHISCLQTGYLLRSSKRKDVIRNLSGKEQKPDFDIVRARKGNVAERYHVYHQHVNCHSSQEIILNSAILPKK